ncbi:hypothetical protein [Bacillus sp. CGMCC 1.16541]|nr:hypothetical protein [Bacillus sp. CGMCC 1.16541]
MMQAELIQSVERHFDWGLREAKELFSNLPNGSLYSINIHF